VLRRLHTRLSLGYIALMAGVFLLLGAYLVNYVQDLERQELRTRLESQAWLVALAAAPMIGTTEEPNLQEFAQDAAGQIDARVTIVDQEGRVLGDSEADPATMENHADRPEVAAALSGQIGESSRPSDTLDRTLIYLAVPIVRDGEQLGAARVALPSDQFAGWLRNIVVAVVAALGIAALAIAALSAILAGVITRPLSELIQTARRIAQGDLAARAPEHAGGEIAELSHAFNEMTTTLQANIEAIEAERARLSAIVEHLTDGILIVDDQGQLALINNAAERLLGTPRDRLLNRPYALAVRDHDLAEVIAQAHSGDEPVRRLFEIGQPRRYVEAVAYSIPHRATPVVVILRDVTELRRTDMIRRDFVANVSHELRTPIASLKALVETLLDGALEDEEVAHEFLARMETEVDGLARLVQDLLELSRAESGRLTLSPVAADIRRVAEQVIARLRTQAEPKKLDIRIEIPDGLTPGRFDPERIEQVLVNLVHNAVKFTPPGGIITVGAAAEDDHLVVWVADTGPGVAPEDRDRIFERFYKTDRSRADAGTGLGLSIARHLVELHGGRIWVDGTARPGTTIKFTLPLALEPAPTGDSTPSAHRA